LGWNPTFFYILIIAIILIAHINFLFIYSKFI
jgi:hypothetical protein